MVVVGLYPTDAFAKVKVLGDIIMLKEKLTEVLSIKGYVKNKQLIKNMNNNQLQSKETNKMPATIMAILGILYGVSPIDILPDIIPVGGWIDDIVITGGGILNLLQAYTEDTSKTLAKFISLIKWTLLVLGGILIAILGLLGVAIYKIFT